MRQLAQQQVLKGKSEAHGEHSHRRPALPPYGNVGVESCSRRTSVRFHRSQAFSGARGPFCPLSTQRPGIHDAIYGDVKRQPAALARAVYAEKRAAYPETSFMRRPRIDTTRKALAKSIMAPRNRACARVAGHRRTGVGSRRAVMINH